MEEKKKLKILKAKKTKHAKKHISKQELKKFRKKKYLKTIIFSLLFISIIVLIIFISFNFSKRNSIRKNLKININHNSFIEELKNIQKQMNDWTKDNENIIEPNNQTINLSFDKPLTLKEKKQRIAEELKIIKKFINSTINATLINFNKCENPKISIVVAVYNGEGYLKNALISIQKQDFQDIEIILIDDCSKDDSVNYIKELMQIDRRIILYQNKENRGALYTKSKGILLSKGKYVMTLDEDDMYIRSDVFSTIYNEAEKDNLDILGFASLNTGLKLAKRLYVLRYLQTPILYQPDIPKRMYDYKENGEVKAIGDVIWNYIFRTDLFQKTIKEIDKKVFNIKMNVYDDLLLFFTITRKAKTLKQIPLIFYLKIEWQNNTKIIFRLNEKYKNRDNLNCKAYANYIRYLLKNTNDTIQDKKIASFELNNYLYYSKCANNTFAREEIRDISLLFLKNEYVEEKMKERIYLYFLDKTK